MATSTLTRADYRVRARSLLGERTPNLFTDTELNDWLNDGQRDIAVKARCIESAAQTLALAAGTQSYAFTGVDPIAIIHGTRALIRIAPKNYGHIDTNATDPQYYWVWNGYVFIDPIPSGTPGNATLYAAGDSEDMTHDAHTSNLPVQFTQLMVLYATYHGLIKAQKFQQAASIYSIYIKELGFHQTNDAAGYARPDAMDEREIPNRYVQVSNPKVK